MGLCRQVADAGKTAVTQITKEIQTRVAVHADETVWRESGQNGYVWLISSTAGCLYEFHRSRAHYVLKGLMGQHRSAGLISDFYCGYNEYSEPQQRCGVHFLRDVHRLKEKYPTDASVQRWATAVRALYDDGSAYCRLNERDAALRQVKKEVFEERAHEGAVSRGDGRQQCGRAAGKPGGCGA